MPEEKLFDFDKAIKYFAYLATALCIISLFTIIYHRFFHAVPKRYLLPTYCFLFGFCLITLTIWLHRPCSLSFRFTWDKPLNRWQLGSIVLFLVCYYILGLSTRGLPFYYPIPSIAILVIAMPSLAMFIIGYFVSKNDERTSTISLLLILFILSLIYLNLAIIVWLILIFFLPLTVMETLRALEWKRRIALRKLLMEADNDDFYKRFMASGMGFLATARIAVFIILILLIIINGFFILSLIQ